MSNDPSICACMNLRKTARLVAQFYDQRLQPSGLRNTQFTLLVTLANFAPLSVSHLAERMGTDRTTLTRNLRVLEQDGLIAGHAGEDARVRLLSLTTKGRKALERARPYWQAAQGEFLERFGRRRWQQLRGGLTEVEAAIASE